MQHAAGAFFPKPRAGKVRRLRRTPRQIRRVLSEWRNCDVLLEIVARQQRHTRSEAKRRAWIIVCDDLRRKRTKEVARAVEKLPRHDLAGYANLAHRVLGQSSEEAPEVILRRLCESVECAWTKWRSALVRAQETRAVEDLHGFRVATKQLRYRIELLYGVGHQDLKAQLRRLAGLQDALGVWHDREMLHHAVAGAIARGAVLLNETPAVRILLGELEKDRMRQTAAVEKVFHLASEQPVRQPIDSGSANPALELEQNTPR